MTNKFKVGDKVLIPSSKANVKYLDTESRIKELGININNELIVTTVGDWEGERCIGVRNANGKRAYGGWMPIHLFEKFIKPKYSIGTKVLAFPRLDDADDLAQIVGRHLNKKSGEFTYLLFTVESGMPIALSESEIKLPKRLVKCECDVEEMTLTQVCQKLGKTIKIIK